MKTANKYLGVTPFPKPTSEKVIRGGIAMIDKKVHLTELTVVVADSGEEYVVGQKVWVRGDLSIQPWAKEVFTIQEKEFVLLPVQHVLVVG